MKNLLIKITLIFAVVIIFNLTSFAASPGALDSSFDVDGKIAINGLGISIS